MTTVAVVDGNPVHVMLSIKQLGAPKKGLASLFQSSLRGRFVQSGGSGEGEAKYTAAQTLPNCDLTIHLEPWSLDVECKFASDGGQEDYRYNCRQFPGEILPQHAEYEISKGKIVIKLPKANPSQFWAGELATKGFDQAA